MKPKKAADEGHVSKDIVSCVICPKRRGWVDAGAGRREEESKCNGSPAEREESIIRKPKACFAGLISRRRGAIATALLFWCCCRSPGPLR